MISRGEINAALYSVAERSGTSEFRVTDAADRVDFPSVAGTSFVIPTDPEAGAEAAPFAAFRGGVETIAVQGFRERELASARCKYVGGSGIDMPGIIHVRLSASQFG